MTTPTTGTDTNISGTLSTPGTVIQEQQRRQEEQTKRRAEDLVSESGSSKEEEEDSPISLDSDEEEYQGSETPLQSDPGKPETLLFKINRPTTRPTPKKPAAGQSARRLGSRRRIVEVGLEKGKEISSA